MTPQSTITVITEGAPMWTYLVGAVAAVGGLWATWRNRK